MRVIWPLPALLAWSLGWLLFIGARAAGAPLMAAIATGVAAGAACSAIGSTPWRRIFIASGFPLSLAVSGLAGAMPAWGWLLPLALLALVYPINAWRDAPLFPTPAGALDGLAQQHDARRTLGHEEAADGVHRPIQFRGDRGGGP